MSLVNKISDVISEIGADVKKLDSPVISWNEEDFKTEGVEVIDGVNVPVLRTREAAKFSDQYFKQNGTINVGTTETPILKPVIEPRTSCKFSDTDFAVVREETSGGDTYPVLSVKKGLFIALSM